jgi:hypothetical protein
VYRMKSKLSFNVGSVTALADLMGNLYDTKGGWYSQVFMFPHSSYMRCESSLKRHHYLGKDSSL